MMGPIMGGGPISRRVAIGGQSNGEGYGVIADLTGAVATMAQTAFDRVYIWNFATNAYEKLAMGANNQGYTTTSFQTTSGTTFGPEFGLAVRWTLEQPRGVLYIDKECVAGEMIEFFQKNSTASVATDHQVPFYAESITRYQRQQAWLAANGKRPRHAGWVWVQGESDAANQANTGRAGYLAALERMINQRITDGLQTADEPRVIVQMKNPSQYWDANIAAAKVDYQAAHPDQTKIITMSNDLGSDNTHLNAKGQTQLGYDTFAAFFNKSNLSA